MKQNHPEIAWKNIAGFRNVVVHGYLGIDIERVWDIVEQDLPRLGTAVDTMIKSLPRLS